MWTGASTAPELDGALAKVNGIEMRLPFQSDPICRNKNQQRRDAVQRHAPVARSSTLGLAFWAIWMWPWWKWPGAARWPFDSLYRSWQQQDLAGFGRQGDFEVNTQVPEKMDGMHDIYYGTAVPPHRKPIPMTHPHERIGEPYLQVDPAKVVAVVYPPRRPYPLCHPG